MGFDISGLGSVADLAKGLVDRFLPAKMTDTEKAQTQLQLQGILEQRENTVIEAQRSIMVAEMHQSDIFTKRARPSIVYSGLAFIALIHVILPVVAWITLIATGNPLTDMPDITLPGGFWATWGGVCSIWVIGRSAEKRGVMNRAVKMITG